MLIAYVNETQTDWDEHLPYVLMAYRATEHSSTNMTPNLMFYGTENRMPIDLLYPIPEHKSPYNCEHGYVKWLKCTIQDVHEHAGKQIKKQCHTQKTYYDKKCKLTKFSEGDLVWRWYPPSANQKLGSKWKGPYKVLKKIDDIHYDIQLQTNKDSQVFRVHVDHLKTYHTNTDN